jgi:hypothetical protein
MAAVKEVRNEVLRRLLSRGVSRCLYRGDWRHATVV